MKAFQVKSMGGVPLALLAAACFLSAPFPVAQTPPVLVQQIISREVAIHVGGVQTPEHKELISRELAVYSGEQTDPPYHQSVSRELTVVVSTPPVPSQVTPLIVTATPTGEEATLSWAGYNELAERDVARYEVYVATHAFTNVAGMTPYRIVSAETFGVMFSNLAPGQDRFFAVVAVDVLGGFDPAVTCAAAYVLAREVVSRECSIFVGGEPEPPCRQAISREVSLVVTTPQAPARIAQLAVSPSPTGETTTLSWAGYNEWGERDVTRYDIYLSTRAFTDVAGLKPYRSVPAETFSITLSGLPPWLDRFYAVVPVDALGGFDPVVNYAAAYTVARELVSREFSVFAGDEPSPPFREVVAREVSIVVSTPEVPAPVTCLGCGLTARDSVNSFRAIDLDWAPYNEVGQEDIVRYRVYLGPAYYDDVCGLEPYAYVPAETKRWTLTGLDPYGVYYVAVVAEDVLGQIDCAVRAQSAQASVDRLHEVRNLGSVCGTNWLTFTWLPPEGADPHTNNLLASYRLYLGAATTAVELDRFTLSYTAADLLAAHGYPIRVATVDNLNRESAGASLLTATLVPNPTETTVNAAYGGTRVSWERVQPEAAIDSFAVYMAEAPFASVLGMTPVRVTRGHWVDFADLAGGQMHWFAVTTRNIGGCDALELPVRVVSFTPTHLLAAVIEDGTLGFAVHGPPGAEYVLEASSDLGDWFPLQTYRPAAMPFTVTIQVSDAPGVHWFYRVLIR